MAERDTATRYTVTAVDGSVTQSAEDTGGPWVLWHTHDRLLTAACEERDAMQRRAEAAEADWQDAERELAVLRAAHQPSKP